MIKKTSNKKLKNDSKNNSYVSPIKKLFDIGFAQITELGGIVTYIIIMILLVFYNLRIAIDLFISLIFIMIVATSIKYFFFKDRPIKQSTNNLVERLDASSFPSIHTMRIFALTFWLSVFFNNILITTYLSLIGILVIYSRIYLKKHYVVDVIGGLLFTALILFVQYLAMGGL